MKKRAGMEIGDERESEGDSFQMSSSGFEVNGCFKKMKGKWVLTSIFLQWMWMWMRTYLVFGSLLHLLILGFVLCCFGAVHDSDYQSLDQVSF